MAVKHITNECGMWSTPGVELECGIQSSQCENQSAELDLRIPIILAVDTSSLRLSLAITRGPEVIATCAEEAQAPHSQTLFPRLAALLDSVQLAPPSIDAFAVATGPGSFTGLRVGLAAVKGLAHTLGRTAIGVTSLDGLALAAGVVGRVVAMIEAGRSEVYCGLREVSADGEVIKMGEDQVGPVSVLLARLGSNLHSSGLVFVGEGARHYRDEIAALAVQAGTQLQTMPQSPGVLFARPERAEGLSSAVWQLKDEPLNLAPPIAVQAHRLFSLGACPGAHAYYIRPSDAELKCR